MALSGMEAAAITGGSQGTLFPEQESNEPDLRWKGVSR